MHAIEGKSRDGLTLVSYLTLPAEIEGDRPTQPLPAVSASLDAIGKADAAMSRWVIAAGLKLIVVPIDSTWMRRSLPSGSRARASHASRARAGRSRERQSKWAGSTCRCTRTALVTAPFCLAPSRPSARPNLVISAWAAAGVAAVGKTHPRLKLRSRTGRSRGGGLAHPCCWPMPGACCCHNVLPIFSPLRYAASDYRGDSINRNLPPSTLIRKAERVSYPLWSVGLIVESPLFR
jgi:hypothetical protein